jgi:hypothetical protein
MSLSEEGSSVSCIAGWAANRSNFCWQEVVEEKAKKKARGYPPQACSRTLSARVLRCACRGFAAPVQLGRAGLGRLSQVQGDYLPVDHIHGIELVTRSPCQIDHVYARASEANHARSPEGRAVGKLLKQVVFVIHRDTFPAFLDPIPS